MITNLSKNASFGVGIRGMGKYLPQKVVTNHDLAKNIETTDEWIKKRELESMKDVLQQMMRICRVWLRKLGVWRLKILV